MYLTAKFDRPTFSHSEVIVRPNKQTDAAENIHLPSLRYATPVVNKECQRFSPVLLVTPVRCLATVVLGKQHAQRLVSLRHDAHQPRIALRQRRQRRPPPAELLPTATVARRQREIVQYRLPAAAVLQAADGGQAPSAAVEDRARLGGHAQRTRGHVLVTVALARVRLARVKVVEVGNDDRNRKCDGEDAGDGAHGADEPAPRTDRRHVAVPDRRHGNHGPPERVRYTAAFARAERASSAAENSSFICSENLRKRTVITQ